MGNIRCRLSSIMGCRRITQRALVRDSGLSSWTVSKLYNEKWSGVDKSTLVKLCETLKVGVGDLLVFEEKKPKLKRRGRKK